MTAPNPPDSSPDEYARRNLLHAKAVGAYANAKAAWLKLRAQKRAPKWLIAALEGIVDRTGPVASEMASHRDEVRSVKKHAGSAGSAVGDLYYTSCADELESALRAGQPHSERAWCDAADWLQHTFPKAAEIAHGVRQEARRRAADPGPTKARLDPEGTATGKTILTAPVEGHNGPSRWPGAASTHIDLETGKRTSLAADPGPDGAKAIDLGREPRSPEDVFKDPPSFGKPPPDPKPEARGDEAVRLLVSVYGEYRLRGEISTDRIEEFLKGR